MSFPFRVLTWRARPVRCARSVSSYPWATVRRSPARNLGQRGLFPARSRIRYMSRALTGDGPCANRLCPPWTRLGDLSGDAVAVVGRVDVNGRGRYDGVERQAA